MKKVFLVIFISTVVLNLQAFIWINDVDCVFSEGYEKSVLREQVISGTMHVLKSKSYIYSFFYEYEKSALQSYNTSESLIFIERSIAELESAKIEYNIALRIGKSIGYINSKVNWFKSFDYDDFVKSNNLNSEIALKVKNYLSSCDIIGIYQQNISNINDILDSLYLVRDRLKAKIKPELKIIWKILQQYSEAALFGNYATLMGSTILGQCEDG
jgi:hypothetical protein